ncbi:MAG: pilin [Candidatus Altiarchaeota archaeon]
MRIDKVRTTAILIFIILSMSLFSLSISTTFSDCKQYGCPPNERCMADGFCTPLSIKEYCEMNGFPYVNSIEKINCNIEKPIERAKLCMQCSGDYKVKRVLSDAENILYIIAVGLSSIFLLINGIKFATSPDYEERENIKKAILYVLIGLIIVFLASKLVAYLYIKMIY